MPLWGGGEAGQPWPEPTPPPAPSGGPPAWMEPVPETAPMQAAPTAAPPSAAPGVPTSAGAGAVLALRTGVVAWLVIFACGLVMAIVTRDTWILGFLGFQEGIAVETGRQALAAMYGRFLIDGESFSHGLHLFGVMPALAAGLTARTLRSSLDGAAAAVRGFWCVAAVIPFLALCTPLVALAEHGRIDVEGRSILFYALVLVGGGALLGMFGLPGRAGAVLKAALAPLGVALAILSAIGVLLLGGLIVTNQMPRLGYDIAQIPRGTPNPYVLDLDTGSALLQSTLAAGNYGSALASAGFLAESKGDSVFPITDARFARLSPAEQDLYVDCLFSADCGPTVRIFDGARELPPLLFLPVVWLTLLIPWGGAVLAGLMIARERNPATPESAIVWGALAGPIWAVAISFLEEIGAGASSDAGSTFFMTLLIASALGAVGGRMYVRRGESPVPETAD